jgi:hypothetical protein
MASACASRVADIRAQVTVRCDCGTEHHVTVTLDQAQVEAAVRRAVAQSAREAAYRGSTGGR